LDLFRSDCLWASLLCCIVLVCACDREETSSLTDASSDIAKDTLPPPAADDGCSSEPRAASANAVSFAETAHTSSSCSADCAKNAVDSAASSASNGLNMDDIMEYLQCEDASLLDHTGQSAPSSANVSVASSFTPECSNQVLSASDSAASATLSLATLQQLASECSTIDLSSLAMGNNVPFAESNGPVSGE